MGERNPQGASPEPSRAEASESRGPLWAPWRMEYILADKRAGGCVLCTMQDAADGEGNLVLARRGTAFAVLNKYPYVNGHLMVCPGRHVARPADLSADERVDLMDLLATAQTVIERAMGPEGFNIGANLGRAAGAGVEEHLHFHVVPRWIGDHNFMPVIGLAHVMPEHLIETYRKLAPGFAEVEGGL